MGWRELLLGLALIVAASLTARADEPADLSEARTLYAEGAYRAAAEAARASDSAMGYALATQITCHFARFVAPEQDRLALFETAKGWALRAVDMAPDNAFVQVQAAHALGRYSQEIGVMKALTESMADRVREHIDRALDLDPDNALAHMLLANWHAEIIDSAGFVGRMIYGAEASEVLAHYQRAVALAPNNLLIRLEYAGAALKVDEDEHKELARQQLQHATSLEPQTALETLLQARAALRLADLEGA